MPRLSSHEPHSIQVYHLNQIGDMLFSLPLLANLRVTYPHAHILSVLRPGLEHIWSMSKLTDEYLVRDCSTLLERARLVKALRKRHPDLAIVLPQSWEPALFAFLSGARRRVGFGRTSLESLLTDVVPKHTPPSVENNLRLLEPLGVPMARKDYVGLIKPSLSEMKRVAMRLSRAGVEAGKRLVILAPGASRKVAIKEWPAEKWAEVANALAARKDTSVAIIGVEPADNITRLVKWPVLDLTRRTTLPELAAMLSMTDLFIGIDSGPMHMAAALGVQVIAIYGPSDPTLTPPMGIGHTIVRTGIECSPCFRKSCPIGRVCLTQLPAVRVIDAAAEALGPAAATYRPG